MTSALTRTNTNVDRQVQCPVALGAGVEPSVPGLHSKASQHTPATTSWQKMARKDHLQGPSERAYLVGSSFWKSRPIADTE